MRHLESPALPGFPAVSWVSAAWPAWSRLYNAKLRLSSPSQIAVRLIFTKVQDKNSHSDSLRIEDPLIMSACNNWSRSTFCSLRKSASSTDNLRRWRNLSFLLVNHQRSRQKLPYHLSCMVGAAEPVDALHCVFSSKIPYHRWKQPDWGSAVPLEASQATSVFSAQGGLRWCGKSRSQLGVMRRIPWPYFVHYQVLSVTMPGPALPGQTDCQGSGHECVEEYKTRDLHNARTGGD